jgi:class 3 adenylate cyclase
MTAMKNGVCNRVLMFTDLENSTALYGRLGEEAAFEAIQKHFELMAGSVKGHGGQVVKTIGDSIMAVFESPEDALKAALEIQHTGREGLLKIRIGIHQGHCFCTRAEQVDYFGTTVNIAARVMGRAKGGEILMTSTVVATEGVTSLLATLPQKSGSSSVKLKGISKAVELVRVGRTEGAVGSGLEAVVVGVLGRVGALVLALAMFR